MSKQRDSVRRPYEFSRQEIQAIGAKFKNGHPEAFDILVVLSPLFIAYIGKHFSSLFFMAEDIVCDMLLRVCKAQGQFDPTKGTIISWLTKICRRICIDALRLQSQTGSVISINRIAEKTIASREMPSMGDPVNEIADSSDSICSESISIALAEVLAALPDSDRRLIIWYANRRDDRSYAEAIGREYSIDAVQVRSKIFTIKRKIREGMRRRGFSITDADRDSGVFEVE